MRISHEIFSSVCVKFRIKIFDLKVDYPCSVLIADGFSVDGFSVDGKFMSI
jgi:hypothetical protein